MKKVLALIAFAGFLTFGMSTSSIAAQVTEGTEQLDSAAIAAQAAQDELDRMAAEDAQAEKAK